MNQLLLMVKINSCIHFGSELSRDGCVRASRGCSLPFSAQHIQTAFIGPMGKFALQTGSRSKTRERSRTVLHNQGDERFTVMKHIVNLYKLIFCRTFLIWLMTKSANEEWDLDESMLFLSLFTSSLTCARCTGGRKPSCSLVNGLRTWPCILFLQICEPSNVKANVNFKFPHSLLPCKSVIWAI